MIRSRTPPQAAGNALAFAVQRRETFLFPEGALREALLNAIVHKDYSSGVPIQISVYHVGTHADVSRQSRVFASLVFGEQDESKVG